MKLLLVSIKSEVSRGGIAVWTDRFMDSCQERGVECLLVNTELVGKRATQLNAKRNFWDELVRTCRIFRDLKKTLKEKPEVAHINTSCGTFGLFRDYMIATRIRRAGVPLITHYHCDIEYWVHNRISRFFLGKLAGKSQCNLVLNSSSQKFLQKNCGIESVRLPNYLEDDQIGTRKTDVREAIETVLYVGRVETAKGSRELYDVAMRYPEIRFLLIGEVSPDAKDWQVPENVELLGSMPHDIVQQYLDQADIFLFPSHSEGCSVALMEAAARGIPMIATDVGANRDIVGTAGVVVSIGDVDAMAQAIMSLKAPEVRREMSRAAVENIRKNFSKDQLEMLFSMIQQLGKERT